MSERRELHSYEYVTAPYERVRDALAHDAPALFQRATVTAAARAQSLVSELRVTIGALEVGREIDIAVHSVKEELSPLGEKRTRIELTWAAAQNAGLFPSMRATLSVYPLSSTETQLDLEGRYEPPLGLVGTALDALIGHRVAEASVRRFVQDIAARLNVELAGGH
jgi:hypothetical protein